MQSIRQGCNSALWSSSNVFAYANGSRRAFSRSTPFFRGSLPNFLEPSSPDLTTLLSTINSKILLPRYLTKEQEKLVYLPANKAKLEADTIEITLGDVTLPLEHINRNHLPKQWATLRQIIARSKTSDDWENVLRIIEGYEDAGIGLSSARRALVIRHLKIAGHQSLVLKALQRVNATNVRLSDKDVLVQVLRAGHDIAAQADWSKEDTTKALKWAKQVVELMDDTEHHGPQGESQPETQGDYRSLPMVVALPTEMAAVLAERHGGDIDEVKKYAGRLVHALKQNDYMTELANISTVSSQTSSDFKSLFHQAEFRLTHADTLVPLVYIWHALQTSRKVLGADMPSASEAQEYEEKIEQTINEGLKQLEALKVRDGVELRPNAFVEYLQEKVRRCQ